MANREAMRERLNSQFGDLVRTALKMEDEMEDVPHKRGPAYISLKPRSGLHIVKGDGGFSARAEVDGKIYEVKFYH